MSRKNTASNWARLGLLLNRLLAMTLVASSSACAYPVEYTQKMIIKLAQPSLEGGEIARMVSQSTGFPVTYVSASSPLIHAVSVACPGPVQCEDALEKLRQDAAFANAEWDRRVRAMQPKPSTTP
jgi:hypothetical protein